MNDILRKKLRLHDTKGVLYTHGLPGIIGGIASTISISLADKNFGDRYESWFYSTGDEEVLSASTWAGYELATLALSMALALFGGVLAGLIASRGFF